ncbi:MAG: head GIN domain-containing protein [Marinilabiliaceae bacterium]
MKRALVFLMALTLTASLLAQDKEENQEVSKEVRKVKDFKKLKVAKGINVTLIKGLKPEAEINIVNAMTEDVIIENDKNELTIKMKTRIYKDVSVQVYLTYTELREIKTGSGASVDAEDVLSGNQLVLDAGMDSSIELEVDVETLEANVSAARITLEGAANTVEAKATTGGKFEAEKLESQEAFVTANTGAVATVNVTKKLEAKAGAGGKIEYSGNPEKVDSREIVNGKVTEL